MARGSEAHHEHLKQVTKGNAQLEGAWQLWRAPSGSANASAHQPQHAHSTNGRHDAAEEGTPTWFLSPSSSKRLSRQGHQPSIALQSGETLGSCSTTEKPTFFSTLRINDPSAGAAPLPFSHACKLGPSATHPSSEGHGPCELCVKNSLDGSQCWNSLGPKRS